MGNKRTDVMISGYDLSKDFASNECIESNYKSQSLAVYLLINERWSFSVDCSDEEIENILTGAELAKTNSMSKIIFLYLE